MSRLCLGTISESICSGRCTPLFRIHVVIRDAPVNNVAWTWRLSCDIQFMIPSRSSVPRGTTRSQVSSQGRAFRYCRRRQFCMDRWLPSMVVKAIASCRRKSDKLILPPFKLQSKRKAASGTATSATVWECSLQARRGFGATVSGDCDVVKKIGR